MKRLLAAALLVTVGLGAAVVHTVRLAPAPLQPAERKAVLALLAGAVDGEPPATSWRLDRPLAGPVVARLVEEGRVVARVEGRGATLGEAARAAAAELARRPGRRDGARLVVDVVVARGPILTAVPWLFALSLVPALDGLGARLGGREALLLPDELADAGLAAAHRPFPGLDVQLGLDGSEARDRLAARLDVAPRDFTRRGGRLFRFRTDSFVEAVDGAPDPVPLLRGHPPAPPLERARVADAARAAGRYLVAHLDEAGRFDYEYLTGEDRVRQTDYSLPRHAGSAWFLAQLHAAWGDAVVKDAVERALAFLRTQAPKGCDPAPGLGRPGACVAEPEAQVVALGSTALTLLALAEHRLGGGAATHDGWMAALGEFLLAMQKADGDFCHLYRPAAGGRDEKTRLPYYSGEAALALARLAALPAHAGDARLADAVDRALDHLTGAQYDHLAGQFFFLEDHWTCMALEAAWDRLPAARRERYGRFCDAFGAFLGRTQLVPGDGVVDALPDLEGAYGLGPFLPPHATPVGSRGETLLSIFALAERRGRPPKERARLAGQLRRGLSFLLGRQLREEGLWNAPRPARGVGGFWLSDAERFVRIDFVQHAGSSLLRAARLDALWYPQSP